MPQSRLIDKKYWDQVWDNYSSREKSSTKRFSKKLLGTGFLAKDRDRSFWLVCKKFLPKNKNNTIFEIGCAPGDLLIDFKRKFGYSVSGMDYSKSGCAEARKKFAEAKIPVGNIVLDDFSSERFHKKYKLGFNIVYSRGFIEHFSEPRKIATLHIDLLKNGGIVLITIPNFSSINGRILALFNKELLSGHNTNIMNLKNLKEIFPKNIEVIYCNYLGHFDFFMFSANSKWKRVLLIGLQFVQLLAEKTIWKIYKPAHTGLCSSHLVFIGRKK